MIRVLVVDDEPLLLGLSKEFLEKAGDISVEVAGSARAAMSSLSSSSCDVIVSDYDMPEMDGIRFLKKIREGGKKTPFILFTGKGREEIVIEALNSGATFYLQKGIDTRTQYAELVSKIRIADRQYRAEQSVQESRRQLESILGFLPDPTIAIDQSGTIVVWNHAAEEMTGNAAAAMLGKGGYAHAVPFYGKPRPLLADLVLHPDERIMSTCYHMREISPRLLIAECEVDLSDGRHRVLWVKATPMYDAEGRVCGAIEIFRDITERVKIIREHRAACETLARKNDEMHARNEQLAAIEEELCKTLDELQESHRLVQESEQKYRALVNTLPDALLIHDEGKIRYGNPAACDLFGVDLHHLVRIPLASLLGNGNGEKLVALSGEAAAGNDRKPFEVSLEKPGGKTLWLETVISPVGDKEKRYTQIFFHDITERKRAEEQVICQHNDVERYARALNRANTNLNLLYSITRHDILNQITVLTGFMELAASGIVDPVMKEYFRKQKCAAQAIYRSILFTRDYQELGIHEPVWQNIQDLATCVTAQAGAPDISFTLHAEGLEVYADPLLEKVFYNLIDNSLRHGMTVNRIGISVVKGQAGIILVYEDNGEGIPDDKKARIFERGYGKNTGLGLYLVQEILALTGITIRETGNAGQGARFEMLIPPGSCRFTSARVPERGDSVFSPIIPL
jgi:PAS domain S-box